MKKIHAGFWAAIVICLQSHLSWAQAPASLNGYTLELTITAAGGGNTGSGSYTISFGPTVATVDYQGHLKTNSYIYSVVNPSTGYVMASAANGSGSTNLIHFYFTDPNDGTYSSTNTSGSYEDGTFTFIGMPPPMLSAQQISTGTNFTFQLSGPAGSNFVLQVSTNLSDWNSISTSSIPVSGSVNLTNNINGKSRQFYRVHL